MASQLTCPHCGNVLRTTASVLLARKMTCSACGEPFTVTDHGTASTTTGPARGAKQSRTGSGLLAVLLPGCGLLLIVGVLGLLAAFVWPGFLRPTTTPLTIADPMALVPADSNWLLGADLDKLRAHEAL